jgi:hypothetical protein
LEAGFKPLNRWNVSNVTNMSWMFHICYVFNQPLEYEHRDRSFLALIVIGSGADMKISGAYCEDNNTKAKKMSWDKADIAENLTLFLRQNTVFV